MTDYSCFIQDEASGEHTLYLQVDGMRCASCAWRIESTLNAMPDVSGRINFSTERLKITWQGDQTKANELARTVEELGFKVAPFDGAQTKQKEQENEKFLMRCMAVAGFATGNIMLFSFAIWFSHDGDMGEATRTLMHWIMALIALPTIIYAGRPFFYSALNVLKSGHTNMDVPISLAVLLASGMSIYETMRHGPYVYFDASVMLLFFLLIGRYLDVKARGRAREAAQGLLAMMDGTATILRDGKHAAILIRDLTQGMKLLVAAGEKVAADGIIRKGDTELDTSLVTGETMPRAAKIGDKIYAGMVNLSAPIEVEITAAGDESLLGEIVGLMESAEQGQAKYVRLADKVAGLYTPVVHALALATFLGWWLWMGVAWQEALLVSMAVLIITCPCALGLAVPVVQVLASSQLFKQGMLLKSGDALERLAVVDTVLFDKTGTLTYGTPTLTNKISAEDLQLAASMAAKSKHPISRALAGHFSGNMIELDVEEIPGHGLQTTYQNQEIKLGKRSWCGDASSEADYKMELWLKRGDNKPTRFTFEDTLRDDAKEVITKLREHDCFVMLLSGDREEVAAHIAHEAGIAEYFAACTPPEKARIVERLKAEGHKVLMVGDGLNDAPALASAHVSMSPSTGVDITQNAADIVFRGKHLSPILTLLDTAKHSTQLVKQNFILSFAYNALAVPLAVMGMVTPLIAAIAMSGSSLLVISNSFRLKRNA